MTLPSTVNTFLVHWSRNTGKRSTTTYVTSHEVVSKSKIAAVSTTAASAITCVLSSYCGAKTLP